MTMRRSRPGRTAFSVIELLMVIFIICMILSLVLPAIQSTREAARRVQCINNLKQLSLALANYETHHKVLPPGVVDRAGPIRNEREGLQIGWIVQLLPYIEQTALYKVFDSEVSVYAPENRTVRVSRINTLLCPSDPEPGKTTLTGVTSYAACHHDVEAPIDAGNHGVFFLNSHISADDVLDGTSFTIYVGEKLTEPAPHDLGWLSGSRSTLRNTGTALNGTPPVNASGFLPSAALPAPGGDQELAVGGFGSRHPGGANFAFGDGSVRFLSSKINPQVYRCLGHRADGEMISDTEF
jgi:prepilin-type processing-associated H-X9-DG protein